MKDGLPSNDSKIGVPPCVLVLSGGGARLFGLAGALARCQEERDGREQNLPFNVIGGTSAGAIVGFFYALGISMYDMTSYFAQRQVGSMFSPSGSGGGYDMSLLFSTKGLFSMDALEIELTKFTLTKLGYLPTFHQVKDRFGVHLIVTAYNYTRQETALFDYTSHPDMACIQAILLSCAMPILFRPILYQGEYYMDGGITSHYPVQEVMKRIGGGMTDRTLPSFLLGIVIWDEIPASTDIATESFPIFLNKLVHLLIRRWNAVTPTHYPFGRELRLTGMDEIVPFYEFYLQDGQMIALFQRGYTQCHEWMKEEGGGKN